MAWHKPLLGGALLMLPLCLVVSAKLAVGEVRCTCGTVPAEGFGSTSCTWHESTDGRCTIVYNDFPIETLDASLRLWSDQVGESVKAAVFPQGQFPTGHIENWRQISGQSSSLVVDTLLMYLGISFTKNGAVDTKALGELARVLRANDTEVAMSFADFGQANLDDNAVENRSASELSLNGPSDLQSAVGDRARVIVNSGCIEAFVGALHIGFKTSWSPARLLAHCGPL